MMRLDKLVAERYGLSRRAAQDAVRGGQVDVAGHCCMEPGLIIEPGTTVVYDANRPRTGGLQKKLRILYEDGDILVVDKPAGLLSQPTPDREPDTLIERAGRYLVHKRGQVSPYIGVVHRLDQDTSGVILLVTSPRALRPFQAMFRAHTIERNYLAVVEGVFLTTSGHIDLRLVADRGDGRKGVARNPREGVPALTHYEVSESFGEVASLLDVRLETGRTHQIRIHLAEIGHPVVGDPVYCARSRPRFPVAFPRQALHAQALGFVHPISGEAIRIEANLPTDLAELIDELRHRFGSAERPSGPSST